MRLQGVAEPGGVASPGASTRVSGPTDTTAKVEDVFDLQDRMAEGRRRAIAAAGA